MVCTDCDSRFVPAVIAVMVLDCAGAALSRVPGLTKLKIYGSGQPVGLQSKSLKTLACTCRIYPGMKTNIICQLPEDLESLRKVELGLTVKCDYIPDFRRMCHALSKEAQQMRKARPPQRRFETLTNSSGKAGLCVMILKSINLHSL